MILRLIPNKGYVVEMGATERIFNNPLHPYTKMLIASVPRLDKKWAEVEVKAERRTPLPDGWVYYESYPLAHTNGVEPTLLNIEPDHFVACRQG